MKICVQCGEPLTARQQLYCSALCRSRGFNAARKADGRLKAYREGKGREKKAAWERENRSRYRGIYNTTRTCPCGEQFEVPWDALRRYCDDVCRAILGNKLSKKVAAQRRLDKAAAGTTGKGTRWVEGPCRRCGDRFLARSNGAIAAYCSHKCSRGDIKDRRRARRAGAEISKGSRFAVYLRDSWLCQICGDPVDPTARVPDLDAPVIDHVIALARGGAHCESNWQTAHFYCNSVKQDRDLDIRAA